MRASLPAKGHTHPVTQIHGHLQSHLGQLQGIRVLVEDERVEEAQVTAAGEDVQADGVWAQQHAIRAGVVPPHTH